MIFFVDEDIDALGALLLELEERGYDVCEFRDADTAFVALCKVPASTVELVIIDVMLAVDDPEASRFTANRTDAYLETGLCLLEDLCPQNPEVFPYRAVLMTHTSSETTLRAAEAISSRFEVPLWKKSSMYAPEIFGDHVVRRLNELI